MRLQMMSVMTQFPQKHLTFMTTEFTMLRVVNVKVQIFLLPHPLLCTWIPTPLKLYLLKKKTKFWSSKTALVLLF